MRSRRALIRKRHDVVMETIELDHDRPRPGEALLQTRASFISAGTELANYTGLDPTVDQPGAWNAYPWPPGYANIASVLAVGDAVGGVSVGQRVYTLSKHCSRFFWRADDPSNLLVPVPDSLDDCVAAASRMAEVAITGLQTAQFALNDWVVVFGLGTIGNLAAQLFALNGARVIGVDPFAPRRALAEQVGVEHVIGGDEPSVAKAIGDLTAGRGAAVCVDAVGDSRVVRQCAGAAADFGQVVLLGSPRAVVQGDLTELTRPVHWRWVTFSGALEWRLPMQPQRGVKHSISGNVRTLLDLVARGRLKVAPLISHRMDPEDIKQAYEGLLHHKDKYFGVALDWTHTRGTAPGGPGEGI